MPLNIQGSQPNDEEVRQLAINQGLSEEEARQQLANQQMSSQSGYDPNDPTDPNSPYYDPNYGQLSEAQREGIAAVQRGEEGTITGGSPQTGLAPEPFIAPPEDDFSFGGGKSGGKGATRGWGNEPVIQPIPSPAVTYVKEEVIPKIKQTPTTTKPSTPTITTIPEPEKPKPKVNMFGEEVKDLDEDWLGEKPSKKVDESVVPITPLPVEPTVDDLKWNTNKASGVSEKLLKTLKPTTVQVIYGLQNGLYSGEALKKALDYLRSDPDLFNYYSAEGSEDGGFMLNPTRIASGLDLDWLANFNIAPLDIPINFKLPEEFIKGTGRLSIIDKLESQLIGYDIQLTNKKGEFVGLDAVKKELKEKYPHLSIDSLGNIKWSAYRKPDEPDPLIVKKMADIFNKVDIYGWADTVGLEAQRPNEIFDFFATPVYAYGKETKYTVKTDTREDFAGNLIEYKQLIWESNGLWFGAEVDEWGDYTGYAIGDSAEKLVWERKKNFDPFILPTDPKYKERGLSPCTNEQCLIDNKELLSAFKYIQEFGFPDKPSKEPKTTISEILPGGMTDLSIKPSGKTFVVEWNTPSATVGKISYCVGGQCSLETFTDKTPTTKHSIVVSSEYLKEGQEYDIRFFNNEGGTLYESKPIKLSDDATPIFIKGKEAEKEPVAEVKKEEVIPDQPLTREEQIKQLMESQGITKAEAEAVLDYRDLVKYELKKEIVTIIKDKPVAEKEKIKKTFDNNPLLGSIVAGVSEGTLSEYYKAKDIQDARKYLKNLEENYLIVGNNEYIKKDDYERLNEYQKDAINKGGFTGLKQFTNDQSKLLEPYKLDDGTIDILSALRDNKPEVTFAINALYKESDVYQATKDKIIVPKDGFETVRLWGESLVSPLNIQKLAKQIQADMKQGKVIVREYGTGGTGKLATDYLPSITGLNIDVNQATDLASIGMSWDPLVNVKKSQQYQAYLKGETNEPFLPETYNQTEIPFADLPAYVRFPVGVARAVIDVGAVIPQQIAWQLVQAGAKGFAGTFGAKEKREAELADASLTLAMLPIGMVSWFAGQPDKIKKDPSYQLSYTVTMILGPEKMLNIAKSIGVKIDPRKISNTALAFEPDISRIEVPKNMGAETGRRFLAELQRKFTSPENVKAIVDAWRENKDVILKDPVTGKAIGHASAFQQSVKNVLFHATPEVNKFVESVTKEGISPEGRYGGVFASQKASYSFMVGDKLNPPKDPGIAGILYSAKNLGKIPKEVADLLDVGKLKEAKDLFYDMGKRGLLDKEVYPLVKWYGKIPILEDEMWFSEYNKLIEYKSGVAGSTISPISIKYPDGTEIKAGQTIPIKWLATPEAIAEGLRPPTLLQKYKAELLDLLTTARKYLPWNLKLREFTVNDEVPSVANMYSSKFTGVVLDAPRKLDLSNAMLRERATGILLDKQGKLVLVQDKNRPYSLAGGAVSKGESAISALKREISEELKVNVNKTRKIGEFTDIEAVIDRYNRPVIEGVHPLVNRHNVFLVEVNKLGKDIKPHGELVNTKTVNLTGFKPKTEKYVNIALSLVNDKVLNDFKSQGVKDYSAKPSPKAKTAGIPRSFNQLVNEIKSQFDEIQKISEKSPDKFTTADKAKVDRYDALYQELYGRVEKLKSELKDIGYSEEILGNVGVINYKLASQLLQNAKTIKKWKGDTELSGSQRKLASQQRDLYKQISSIVTRSDEARIDRIVLEAEKKARERQAKGDNYETALNSEIKTISKYLIDDYNKLPYKVEFPYRLFGIESEEKLAKYESRVGDYAKIEKEPTFRLEPEIKVEPSINTEPTIGEIIPEQLPETKPYPEEIKPYPEQTPIYEPKPYEPKPYEPPIFEPKPYRPLPFEPKIYEPPPPTSVISKIVTTSKTKKIESFEDLSTEQRLASIAWKQGFIYRLIYPPYGSENQLFSKDPFPGVKVASGPQSAYDSVSKVEGAEIPDRVEIDMGIVNVGFEKDKKTNNPIMYVIPDPYQKIPARPLQGYPKPKTIRRVSSRTESSSVGTLR